MTWEIAIGIFALASFVATFVGAAWKISKVLSTLEVTINMLKQTLEQLQKDSKKEHGELFEKIDDHEQRITKLETINEFSLNT